MVYPGIGGKTVCGGNTGKESKMTDKLRERGRSRLSAAFRAMAKGWPKKKKKKKWEFLLWLSRLQTQPV